MGANLTLLHENDDLVTEAKLEKDNNLGAYKDAYIVAGK